MESLQIKNKQGTSLPYVNSILFSLLMLGAFASQAQNSKNPIDLRIGVNPIPAVSYSHGEFGAGPVIELLSMGTDKLRVGAGVFPNVKLSGVGKNGFEGHIRYNHNKGTSFVVGASREGGNTNPFVGVKFMIGGKGRKK